MLASKSPRRRELLTQLGVAFDVVDAGDVKEDYPLDLAAEDVAPFLSRLKADACRYLADDTDGLVITADTVVVCDGEVLGKPKNLEDAKVMLATLSGKTHTVVSGVTVFNKERCETISVKTSVTFSELTTEEIDYYVECYKPLDKAGAYGIQEWIGGVAVESIEGSFYNVMGLPVHQLYKLLRTF